MIRPNLALKMIFLLALLALASFSAGAQTSYTPTTLYSFTNATPDVGRLIMDAAGNLYGTTPDGGAYGLGTVFELVNSSGTYTEKVLYSFKGSSPPITDGANPTGPLLMDAVGNLYGTTTYGGCTYPGGCGTVFELVNSSGTYTETVLYNFNIFDGSPTGGVIMDKSGNLFGTTVNSGRYSSGTVYELANSYGTYTETVLYTFDINDNGGAYPAGGLIMDASGNLFGTASYAGAFGGGGVFELVNSSGTYTETVLHNFAYTDGAYPYSGLIMDASGNLFGTASYGGANSVGLVFELVNSSGTYTETVLHTFTGAPDGAKPQAGLLMDAAGNLYGTTPQGGANGLGTVFELVNSSGTYTEDMIYSFGSPQTCGSSGPAGVPVSALIMDRSGNLYGTTVPPQNGGVGGYGTVFEITQPPSQTVGTTVALSSSMNPAMAGDSLSFTATVTSSLPTPPSGTVTFFNGSTQLGAATVACGTAASVGIADSLLLGIGTSTITAQYNPNVSFYAPSSASLTQTVTESGVLLTRGNDTLNGNLTVTGAVTGSFSGDGSGLVGVNALTAKMATTAAGLSCTGCVGNTQLGVNYAGSGSQGGPATSAVTAANSTALAGVPGGNYARLDIDNNFAGNQTLAGNLSVSGLATIGRGTPIKEHLSMLVEDPVFQNEVHGVAPNDASRSDENHSRAACATISFPGVSDGDTIALGVPNSREAGGVIFYFAWAAVADTIKLCRTVLVAPDTQPSGAIRIDVWKH